MLVSTGTCASRTAAMLAPLPRWARIIRALLHPHAARDRRAGLRGQAGHRAHRGGRRLLGCAWPWAAAWRCSWPAVRRSGTRCGSARCATGWARSALALAASAVGVTLSVAAEMALLTLIVSAAIAAERRDPQGGPPGGLGGRVPPTGGPGNGSPREREQGGLGGLFPPRQ